MRGPSKTTIAPTSHETLFGAITQEEENAANENTATTLPVDIPQFVSLLSLSADFPLSPRGI